jgi:hypothetical protein
MKTYRQNLNLWLEEKKNSSKNDEVKYVLEEVQKYIKSKEKEEELMVNDAYETGYNDKESQKGFKSAYYKQRYKLHDKLKELLKLN